MAAALKDVPVDALHIEKRSSTAVDATVGVSEFRQAHALDTIEYTKPGAFVWLCAAATAIGGMLFGYDTGVISGVLVVIGKDLDNKKLSSSEKELIVTLCAAGACIGAIIADITADKFGRKPATWFASILFTLGALIQATAYSIAQMSVGRTLIGLGVGSASMIVPLYIAEISPARFRGRMISVDMIFLGTGSVLAYVFDAAFEHSPHGWRYMIGLEAIPSILLGRKECARVIRRIYPNEIEHQIADKVLSIEIGITQVKALYEEMTMAKTLKALFFFRSNLRPCIAACGLMLFQQMCGFNTLMYYSSTLFAIVGFSNPIAVGTTVAYVNWLFTVTSIFLIDRVGRHQLLLWTMWGMLVCLLLAAISFHWVPIDRETLQVTSDNLGWSAILVLVARHDSLCRFLCRRTRVRPMAGE
ncbi:uncharacterized protein Z518_03615 [Rhinocladiella mackenziei CBS 650.93]|uniref:Major facilitator superfamily (MFS) profile domain-containing protein n=1 Tax=Rhinocladiella mackenziei CBS 650.93 TaxID=1442369 RepID=A0A0D2H5F2_9EURO|nr:uncharacterized protein Z518_03615 [Rhinocladiella mackenziei CBS 650.93]KIX05643.1 hypothetical protein Z518_03615 [Rhinocladiella mackenziei CBS 650.93]